MDWSPKLVAAPDLIDAAHDAADMLVVIETAAAAILDATADQRDQVIKGFRRAGDMCRGPHGP